MTKQERDAAYYARNRERILARARAKYAGNPEPYKTKSRAAYWDNLQAAKAYRAAVYAADPARVIALSTAWGKANPERRREQTRRWKQAHPEAIRANTNARRRKLRQQRPPWADRIAIRQIYRSCPAGFHVDHIIPLRGETVSGLHVESNLRHLPAKVNYAKGRVFAEAA